MKKLVLLSMHIVVLTSSIFILGNQEVFGEQAFSIGTNIERSIPELNANNIEIQQDEKFNPFDTRIGLEATEKVKGDLTDKIKVISNNVNTAIPGTYQVTYEVKNSRNEVAKKSIEVKVRINDTWPNGKTAGWKMFSGQDIQLLKDPELALVGDYTFYSDSHASLYKHYTGNEALENDAEYRVTVYIKPQNGKPIGNLVKVSLKDDPSGKESREIINTSLEKGELAEKGYYRLSQTFKVGENETNPLIVVENFSAGYIGSINISKKEDQTTLELQDVELYVGETFDLDSPFKNVTDKDGEKLSAKDIEWYYINNKKSKELDTSKPGTHKVKISYQNKTGKWLYSNEITVTVKEKNTQGTVTVKYYDSNMYREVAPAVTLTGRVGDSYKTSLKHVSGYAAEKTSNNTTGVFTKEPQEVTYVYADLVDKVRTFGKQEAESLGTYIEINVKRALDKQSNKLGYNVGDRLTFNVGDIWKKEIIKEIPVKISLDTRVNGYIEYDYFNGALSLHKWGSGVAVLEKSRSIDLSDRMSLQMNSSGNYTIEQWDPEVGQWINTKQMKFPVYTTSDLDIAGHYEKGPK